MFNFANSYYLYLNSVVRLVVKEKEILIERINGELWKISVPIFNTPRLLEKEIESCLYILYQLKRILEDQDKGSLEIDSLLGIFYWVQYIHPSEFGKNLQFFLEEAQKWEKFFLLKESK